MKRVVNHLIPFLLLISLFFVSCNNTPEEPVIYTVNFISDGSVYMIQAVPEETKLTEPQIPTKKGYEFSGWYYDSTCLDIYSFDSPVYSNFNLYAGWILYNPDNKPTFTVSFNSNGGNGISSITVIQGESITEPVLQDREGYIFAGWYTDSDLTIPYDFDKPVTSNLTLYAAWRLSSDVDCTITFVTSGGTPIASQIVKYGGLIAKPEDPTRVNYSFAGWYSDPECTATYDFNSPVINDMKLYAKWDADGIYTVSFHTDNDIEIPSQTLLRGELVTEPEKPKKIGYIFTGWYDERSLTEYDFSTPINSNLNLYAQWEEAKNQSPTGTTSASLFSWYENDDGTLTLSDFNDSSNIVDIIIPSEVNGRTVKRIGGNAFYNSKIKSVSLDTPEIGNSSFSAPSLETVVLRDGVVSIGGNAFSGTNLSSIDIPDSVTFIGSSAFAGCDNLKTIRIPMHTNWEMHGSNPFSNSSIETIILEEGRTEIPEDAFSGCSSLKDIELPDSVTSIGNSAFFGCESLKEITIPVSVKEFGHAFLGSSIETVIFEGERTEIPGDAFSGCSMLKNIGIPDSVTSIGSYAFSGCESLKEITIPETLKEFNQAFSGSGIETVIFEGERTEIPEYAFYGCSNLKNIELPDSVTSIGNSAFFGCESLKEITIPASVKEFGQAFSGSGIETVIFEGERTEIPEVAFNGCSDLKNIEIPDSVTSIGTSAFSGCESLKEITIPVSVKEFGQAFSGSGIEAVIFEGERTEIPEYAFSGCSNLKNIEIPDSVTSIGSHAFSGCRNLKNIGIPDSVTSIGSYAFSGCSNLKNIEIPDSVTSIANYVFYECTNLVDVILPSRVESIGGYIFFECTNLKNITMPIANSINPQVFSGSSIETLSFAQGIESISGYLVIGDYLSSLKCLIIPAEARWINSNYLSSLNVETIILEEGYTVLEATFRSVDSLINISLPSTLTSIPDRCFASCSSLKEITIPENVDEMGSLVFNDCTNLKTITIEKETIPSSWNTDWLGDCSATVINTDGEVLRQGT